MSSHASYDLRMHQNAFAAGGGPGPHWWLPETLNSLAALGDRFTARGKKKGTGKWKEGMEKGGWDGIKWEGLRRRGVRKDGEKEGRVFARPLLRSFRRICVIIITVCIQHHCTFV